jgi:Salmonella virulence plasmid 65kDa B protein
MKENNPKNLSATFSKGNEEKPNAIQSQSVTLPKGGGAIKGIEEKFQVNAVTGTSSFSIPIPRSPSRGGYTPGLGLAYNSGAGNSPFGMGWQLGIASICRKTDKKLPEYKDAQDSDTFMLSGAEDLVPLLEKQPDNSWKKYQKLLAENGTNYSVIRYRSRIESSFARIERFENTTTGDVHWRTISTDNIHSYFGLSDQSRVSDPHGCSATPMMTRAIAPIIITKKKTLRALQKK